MTTYLPRERQVPKINDKGNKEQERKKDRKKQGQVVGRRLLSSWDFNYRNGMEE